MPSTVVRKYVAVAVAVAFLSGTSNVQSQAICDNRELRKAVDVIHRACSEAEGCRFKELAEIENVDRASLLAALRSPYLYPVHIFFPYNEPKPGDSPDVAIAKALDWKTSKRAQLETLRGAPNLKNAAVFVIGRASWKGDQQVNREISRRRMEAVLSYLKNELHLDCKYFKGGYLGKEYLQLSSSDARLLNLEPQDYRDDPDLILNQAVHVFIFPCADRLSD